MKFYPVSTLETFSYMYMCILLQRYAYERDRMSVTRSGSRPTFGDALFFIIYEVHAPLQLHAFGDVTREEHTTTANPINVQRGDKF